MKDSFLDDIKTTASDGLKRRFSDPILATFSVSFLLWNYEIFLFVFSKLDPGEKVSQISARLHCWTSYVGPILISVFILFLLPRLTRLYDWIEGGRVERENVKIRAEKKLLPYQFELEQANRRLEAEVQRNNEANSRLSEKDQVIGSLRNEVKTLQTSLAELNAQSNAQGKWPKDQEVREEIRFLDQNNIDKEFRAIADGAAVGQTQYVHKLNNQSVVKMIAHGLLSRKVAVGGDPYVELTELGARVHRVMIDE